MNDAVTLSRWRVAIGATVCVALGALGAYALTGSDADPEPAKAGPAAAELAALADTRQDVTAVISDGPLAYAPASAPTESTPDAGVIVYERGTVDFAAGTAEVARDAAVDANTGPNTSGATHVSGSGTTIVHEWGAQWPIPLDGVTDTWRLDAALPPLSVDTTITTFGALLDAVANTELFAGERTSTGAVTAGELDADTLQTLTDERLAGLDDDLAAIIDGDLTSGARATPTGAYSLEVSDSGVDVLRVQYQAGERIFTLSWFLTPTDSTVGDAPDGEPTDYATWRAAFDAAFTGDGAADGDTAPTLPPTELPELTDDELNNLFGN